MAEVSAPKRIQRKRTKGWRMPDGAVYIGRPTRWGNPFLLSVFTPLAAVQMFREQLLLPDGGILPFTREHVSAELRGKDLACWCPPDQPCHADVLLEIANG